MTVLCMGWHTGVNQHPEKHPPKAESNAVSDLPASDRHRPAGLVDRAFLAHPRQVDETYWQHFAVAGGFGVQLLKASMAAFVHALVPAACERTASTIIKTLHARMSARH